GSFERVLASDVDAVIIATPVFLHADHLEAAVKAGKHVYIEKPAMPDVAGCKRMIKIADSADRKLNLTMGFQRHYGQVYLKAKERLDSGAIGDIRLVHLHFIKSSGWIERPAVREPQTIDEKIRGWHPWRDLAGDLIVENNVHLIDVMNWFVGGHPELAVGLGGRTVAKIGDMRDHGNVSFLYDNGVQGALIGTTLAPSFYRNVHEQYFGETGVIETAGAYWKHYKSRDDVFEEASPRNVTTDALDSFVRRIAEGKPENAIVRGAESTLTAILGSMAMDARGEVTWEEMMRTG
ncbi:MAG: Gfo/Idh/MocA family oxidoreductase, partial [Acidobacteria bacterium]|nr:Gfo/Idh/MocA family oxidoreductase [Acidobacteriota bacterium]